MARIELVRIKDGKETVLEVTEVPDNFTPSMVFYSPNHIEELEKHYRKTGKPKRGCIDVIYVTRPQRERW